METIQYRTLRDDKCKQGHTSENFLLCWFSSHLRAKILRPVIYGARIFSTRTSSEPRWNLHGCVMHGAWCLVQESGGNWGVIFFCPAFQNACPPVQHIWSSWLSCEADGSGDIPKFQAESWEWGIRWPCCVLPVLKKLSSMCAVPSVAWPCCWAQHPRGYFHSCQECTSWVSMQTLGRDRCV